MKPGNRKERCGSEPAADKNHFFYRLNLGRIAQRTAEIQDGVTDLHRNHFASGFSHSHNNQADGPRGWIDVSERERDSFTAVMDAQDDKLARLGLF